MSALLGFDFGRKRIGVAVGDRNTAMAHPLASVAVGRRGIDWQTLETLIEQWRPAELVVGLPVALDGARTPMSAECQRFGNELAKRFRLPVRWVDERLTSEAARWRMREIPATRSNSRVPRDPLAAQLILETYLSQTREPA